MVGRNKLGRFIKGRKCPQEEIDKIAQKLKGRKRPLFSEEWRKKIGDSTRGKPGRNKGIKMPPRSEECRRNMSDAHRGSKAYNYKGGRKSLVKKIRETYKYRQWRSDVFERDNWTCQTCQKRGGYLEAHHIKLFAKLLDEFKVLTVEQALYYEEIWDTDNGVTLCSKCHNLTKRGVKSLRE